MLWATLREIPYRQRKTAWYEAAILLNAAYHNDAVQTRKLLGIRRGMGNDEAFQAQLKDLLGEYTLRPHGYVEGEIDASGAVATITKTQALLDGLGYQSFWRQAVCWD
jgi:hypothetical protein